MEDPEQVRKLYEGLDDVGKKALEEATHDSDGALDGFVFQAKYGQTPGFGGIGKRYGNNNAKPTALRLFFPDREFLPSDLQSILSKIVPEPSALAVHADDELPPTVRPQLVTVSRYRRNDNAAEVELTVRNTAPAALHDVKAVLRLIDMGHVSVGEKTRRPSAATLKVITEVLAEGDFYAETEQTKDAWEPVVDLRMQAFAWPMLVQAARLAESSGTRLQLTTAGRKATTAPAHELIRQIWEKWQKTTLLDEFSRIDAIKGQQGKGRVLTAVPPRRDAIIEVLQECPAQKWIATDEFFRVLKVLAPDFDVTYNMWMLYFGERRYGSLGTAGSGYLWEIVEGRYALAFLFEYAATLGLVDVAYLPPRGVRDDYGNCWGTDELTCLSRYDGLFYFRINPLGAWCLGLAENYEPGVVQPEPRLRVLPNLDVVAAEGPITPADVLLLQQFAERKSEALWQLGSAKILEAVEKGSSVGELMAFLEARNHGPLPQTVKVFLDDLAKKVGQLKDLGTARLIACADASLAQLLVRDRRLRNLCQLAGDDQLVFRAADETTIRRILKELGYVLPPAG